MTRTAPAAPVEAPPSDLALYSRAARRSAATIIHEYSTSFSMATRLLSPQVRPSVEDVYALVRVADEIVDGAAAEAGLGVDDQRALLDALEADTERAMRTGYSANVVVHAFAGTARMRARVRFSLLVRMNSQPAMRSSTSASVDVT